MTIEQKLGQMRQELPIVSDYMENKIIQRLENQKIIYQRKNVFNFKSIAIAISIVLVLSISVMLLTQNGNSTDRIESGYILSAGAPNVFDGYVALGVKDSVFDLKETIPFTFSYGQLYSLNDETTILNHSITVYVANWFKTYPTQIPANYYEQTKIMFENRSFLDTSNRLLNEGPLLRGDEIKYQKSFDLSIDFNEIHLTQGVVVIEVARTIIFEDDNGDYEGIEIKQSLLYFKKDGEHITFTLRPFV